MKVLKRLLISLILIDNFLSNFPKRLLFKTRWKLKGQCRQCGTCCKSIYLRMTPRQMQSRFFTNLSIKWISWVFDFKLIGIDRESLHLIFSCQHLGEAGRCQNYFWRPNICRNYPLVDYFDEPALLPSCGFKAYLDG